MNFYNKWKEEVDKMMEEQKEQDRVHAMMAFRVRMGNIVEPTERDIELELQNIYFMSDLAEELYHDGIKKRKITPEEARRHVESFTQDKREQDIMLWELKKIYKMTAHAREEM